MLNWTLGMLVEIRHHVSHCTLVRAFVCMLSESAALISAYACILVLFQLLLVSEATIGS
jgi:hypothetical protein